MNSKVVNATKWAALTQLVAKLIAPITNMVLARLLTPEAFGVVATLTMIITFAELFTDAGFQKYLIQKEFSNDHDFEESVNVAFWSNFMFSIVVWIVITIFSESLASLVGSPGMGIVLVVACSSIPLAAFSSIQMALYQRVLDFKTLFKVRIIAVLVPLVVTIPLAVWLRNYWALVIGTIIQNAINALFLTFYSKWKPSFFYSFRRLKEMFSFTIWTLLESISIWLTSYVDIFIVGKMLNQHYLGLYNTTITTVGQIMGLVLSATTPVLFSGLSRVQSDDNEFKNIFYKFQKYVSVILIPLGVGIFCYSHVLTEILLGDQWYEAQEFIGLWGITSALTILLAQYASEVYRSKGRPKLSFVAQWLHLIVLVPVIIIAANYGFKILYVSRSLIRVELILVNMLILHFLFSISAWKMLLNIMPAVVASFMMLIVALILKTISDTLLWNILSIVICAMSYLVVISLFSTERKLLASYFLKLK